MEKLRYLLKSNKEWVTEIKERDPEYFTRLAQQKAPKYLWIGCSDNRIVPNQIINTQPGEVFVHRNIANVVLEADINCLSVIQYAVEVLNVKHIILCGHYDCGGVKAVLENNDYGILEKWLSQIKDVFRFNSKKFQGLNHENKIDLLCEMNVKEQVKNICETAIVRKAWEEGKELTVHGWIYSIKNGLLKNLDTFDGL
ncbi:MAG: carbonic anhydrase [bacterium]